jgi:hypothetical protein
MILEQICASYRNKYHNPDDAYRRVCRDINEIIDIFNSLDDMITEIDKKNKTYVNSTIGKIEFLLKDDNNVPGKINTILKHISVMHKKGKVDSAITMVQPIFALKGFKSINESSLYTPRGTYAKPEPQKLLTEKNDIFDIKNEFFKQYETIYTEDKVLNFVNSNMTNNKLQVGSLINEESTIEDILMVVYSLIYTNSTDDEEYSVIKLDNMVENTKFKFNDFMIIKEEK